MRTRVRKWGNSLGLRIPKAFAEEAAIRQDCVVDVSVSDGQLLVRPVSERYELEALLEAVTSETLHAEIETGSAVGREEW